MSFANPIWLWGLFALLIPLAIHLLSKKQTQVLPFGSIRFLRESASSQSRSIQLSDVLLLILRLLLFILIITWLAGWISPEKREKQNWLILGEGIDLPEAYRDAAHQQLLEVKMASTLTEEKKYPNQWYFLEELAVRHPEIDSLTWIDNFSEVDFWGNVPTLPYSYELINFGNKDNQVHSIKNDTIFYKVENLSEENKTLIANALVAISEYSGKKIIYSHEATQLPDVLFSDNASQKVPLQFLFRHNEIKTYTIENKWPVRIIHLSESYLKNALMHDELLMILTEFLVQNSTPLWYYNSFDQATAKPQKPQYNSLVYNSINETEEWLFWLILAVLLVERVWTFRKTNA